MKKIKMVRSLDKIGRLVIPIELRRAMGISAGDPVQMEVSGESVILRKHLDVCFLCGSKTGLVAIEDEKKLCSKCIKKIGDISKEI